MEAVGLTALLDRDDNLTITSLDPRESTAPSISTSKTSAPGEITALKLSNGLQLVHRHDPLVPPAVMHRFASLIPGAECVEFDASGHSPYFEEPDAFNAMLERVIAGA